MMLLHNNNFLEVAATYYLNISKIARTNQLFFRITQQVIYLHSKKVIGLSVKIWINYHILQVFLLITP